MLTVRELKAGDNQTIIALHLRLITLDLGCPPEMLREDWQEKTTRFIARAQKDLAYKCFVAEIDGEIVGSTSCQILELYPMVNKAYQKGYIWGVYVDGDHRRQGIATELMRQAANHLQQVGCTNIVLHASDAGEKLYTRLGYQKSNEMVLTLS